MEELNRQGLQFRNGHARFLTSSRDDTTPTVIPSGERGIFLSRLPARILIGSRKPQGRNIDVNPTRIPTLRG